MNPGAIAIDAQQTLAGLATNLPAAARVFQHHGLDFCCNGEITLGDACRKQRLDVDAVLDELRTAVRTSADGDTTWAERPLPELIDHLLAHYHRAHREELPALLSMAAKVERVHGERAECPHGLTAHLCQLADELDRHMQKEELVLFPMLRSGHGSHAVGPIQVMEAEHKDHGQNLARLRQIAHGFRPPAAACNTWRALYLGLETFERDVMRHIHLENHVLFPRVLTT